MILPFRFCRKHVLQRACGGIRDQNALPGVPAIRLQPSLRSFDVPENTRLHVGSASMMKSDCQHIWKQHPCPMCWPPVAPDFILLTVDNQLKQLGRPQATIRFWCGALKYECRLLHAQARPLRGRLHARQKEGKKTHKMEPQHLRQPTGTPASGRSNALIAIGPHCVSACAFVQTCGSLLRPSLKG